MKRLKHLHLAPVAVSVSLISLIMLSVEAHLVYSLIMLAIVAAGAVTFYAVFPSSRFFAIAFANGLAVYACVFIFFIEANFLAVPTAWLQVGFAMPILAFLGGAWFRRDEIQHLLESPRLRDERHFGRLFIWLIPMAVIGTSTFPLSELARSPGALTLVFFGAMSLTSLIVFVVSGAVCTFLLDTGLVFEDFFKRMAALVVPAFAFFTFYSLIVIVFAAVYRLVDRYGLGTHFLVSGEARSLNFTESLYFSIITLSTVGYGDVVPQSPSVRVIVGLEIICGVLLLLFGFSEIISYSREHTRRRE
jgi:voltage-gated potassium channel